MYTFDNESCSFVEVETSPWDKVRKFAWIAFFAVLVAGAATLGLDRVIDTPEELALLDENRVLQQQLESEQQLLEYAQFADGSRGSKAGDFSLFAGPSKLRQIAIPTTLSGAEFSNNAGVTDPVKSLKEG